MPRRRRDNAVVMHASQPRPTLRPSTSSRISSVCSPSNRERVAWQDALGTAPNSNGAPGTRYSPARRAGLPSLEHRVVCRAIRVLCERLTQSSIGSPGHAVLVETVPRSLHRDCVRRTSLAPGTAAISSRATKRLPSSAEIEIEIAYGPGLRIIVGEFQSPCNEARFHCWRVSPTTITLRLPSLGFEIAAERAVTDSCRNAADVVRPALTSASMPRWPSVASATSLRASRTSCPSPCQSAMASRQPARQRRASGR